MYTPFVYISYAIDYKIGGLNPFVYHTTNLLLHLLNITILFFSIRLLTKRIEIAAIVAFLFAVHPMNTGAVAPISTRSGLLYSSFFLAAFLSYLIYLQNEFRIRYLVLTFILFLMALFSKSAAVVLPLILLLVDYYYDRKFDSRSITEKIPFFALSLIFGILTFTFRGDVGLYGNEYAFSAFDRIFLVGYSLLFYLFKMFIPVNLSAYYPYPVKIDGNLPLWFYTTPLVVAVLAFLAYRLKKFRMELVFGSLFFLINMVLVLKIIPMGGEMVSERYAYLPYIGLFLIIGWTYCRLSDRYSKSSSRIKYLLIIGLAVYGIAISAASHERIKVWKDSITLFDDVLAKDPIVDVAYNNRGMIKMELKDYAGAIQDLNKAVELNPKNAIAFNNRGNAKIDLRDYSGAIEDFNRAIELNPKNAAAYANRGNAKSKGKNDYKGAMADFEKAIELDPFYLKSFFNRALLRMEQKDHEGALSDYNRVIEIDPNVSRAYYGIGNIRVFQKDYEGAAVEYGRAIALNPGYAEAYRNRGNMRMMQERHSEAVADYSQALRLNPQDPGVYFKRGWSKWFVSDREGACTDWRSAFERGYMEASNIMQRNCK
jgi:tetratricopeptide (TPR) repeat protein